MRKRTARKRGNMRNRRKWNEAGKILAGMIFSLAVFWLLLIVAALGNRGEETNVNQGIIGKKDNWAEAAATPEKTFPETSVPPETISQDTTKPLETELPETAEPSTIEPQPSSEVSIMAVGDNLMHASVSYSGLQPDGSWNFSHLFAQIQPDIQEADVRILCQEVIMGGLDLGISGYPNFNTVQEIGHSIAEAGFNVVAFANNHVMDKGADGILRTIHFWKEHYPEMCYTGIHESREEQNQICVIERNGIRIAVLNYTYGMNGHTLPAGQEYLVDLSNDFARIQADIQAARTSADFIIVIPHWGTEYSYDTSTDQQNLTRFLADNGVDLVIGSHPHVVQPVEWVERTGYARPMLVYYSLGNFVSIQDKTSTMLGAMAKISIQKQNGETFITDHSLKLLVTHYEMEEGNPYFTHITTYPLEQYTPELAARHGIRGGYDPSFSYEAIVQNGQWLMTRVQ